MNGPNLSGHPARRDDGDRGTGGRLAGRLSSEPTRVERAVVVGVDGARGNQAAIDRAVQRALGAHRPLCMVAMLDKHWPAATCGEPLPDEPERNWRSLSDLRDRLRIEFPDLVVDPEVRIDDAVDGLLDFGASATMIVLGHRGVGAASRAVRGSTSMAVAGRSIVPVVVVPPDCRNRRAIAASDGTTATWRVNRS